MSRIPSIAIPHAGPQAETEATPGGTESRFDQLSELGSGIAEMVREHPRTAAIAGAAVVGLAAAAAIPAIRGRVRGQGKGGSKKRG